MERKTGGFVDDFIKFSLIALLIILPIRTFVAQPFIVRGASMVPTFHSGEYLIVDQISYRFEDPQRGDVIILRYPKDSKIFFIKRIIGLPGETVEILGESIVIQRSDDSAPVTIEEPYIDPSRIQNEYGVYTLGDGEYFVMGDNRVESSDSRSWGILKRDGIVGRAFLRVLPPQRLNLFPGQETHNEKSL